MGTRLRKVTELAESHRVRSDRELGSEPGLSVSRALYFQPPVTLSLMSWGHVHLNLEAIGQRL